MSATYASALRAATAVLAATSPTARLDSELLLSFVCGVPRIALLTEWQTPLSADEAARFDALVARRALGEPVAYLVGTKEFYGREFAVDRRVLVPRPETELLVEQALAWARRRTAPPSIADIGTGSGCIAVTLALELPGSAVAAVDLSADALAIAALNCAAHAVGPRVALLHGDGFAPLAGQVDLVVTNPPYTVLAAVDANVRDFEPHLALDGFGDDGLAVIQRLIAAAPRHLAADGALFMEIGAWQGAAARALAAAAFPAAQVSVLADLAGHDRLLAVIC